MASRPRADPIRGGGSEAAKPSAVPAIAMAVIVAVAVALHVVRCAHAGGLWRDEVAALEVARAPTWAELWSGMSHEILPVLPLALFRVFGNASDQGLRVLGCVVGLLALAALAWSARAAGVRRPLVGLLLLGTSVVVVGSGDSIRHYGISMVFVALLVGATWRVVESATPGRIATLAVLGVLAVQCAYPNAFLLLGTACGGAAVLARRRQWKRIGILAGCGAVAALSLLPYAGHWKRMAEWAVVVQSDVTLSAVLEKATQALGSPHPAVAAAWAVAIAATVAAAFRRSETALFAAVTLAVGAAGYLLWLVRARYVTYAWNYLPLVALLAVAVEIGIAAWSQAAKARTILAASCGALAVVLAPTAWTQLSVRQTNADLLAARMNASVGPQDLVVACPWYARLSLQRYYKAAAPMVTVPPIGPVRWHRFDLVREAMLDENAVLPVTDAMTKTLKAGHRVWICGALHFLGRGVPPPALAPASRSGIWASYQYDDTWSSQVAQAILPHIAASELVEAPGGDPINPIETLPLFVVQGWVDGAR